MEKYIRLVGKVRESVFRGFCQTEVTSGEVSGAVATAMELKK